MDSLLVALSLTSAVCFALALVLTQLGLRALTPLSGTSISVPTTTALFLLLSPFTVDLGQWRTESALVFAVVGLLYPVTVTLLTFAATRAIGPNLTGVLGNLAPVFAVAIAVVLLGETPRVGQLAGLIVVCAGIALLFAGRHPAVRGIPAWAWALPLGAALVRGLIQPAVKIGLEGWPNPFAAVTIGYLVSSTLILTAKAVDRNPAAAATSRAWGWFVPVGLCNGLGVLSLYSALGRGPVTIVAPLVACYPVFTLLLNRLLLADRSLPAQAVSGVLVTVAGIALILAS